MVASIKSHWLKPEPEPKTLQDIVNEYKAFEDSFEAAIVTLTIVAVAVWLVCWMVN